MFSIRVKAFNFLTSAYRPIILVSTTDLFSYENIWALITTRRGGWWYHSYIYKIIRLGFLRMFFLHFMSLVSKLPTYNSENSHGYFFHRAHLRDIRDRSVLRLFEATDIGGGAFPGAVGVGSLTMPPNAAPPCSGPSSWDQVSTSTNKRVPFLKSTRTLFWGSKHNSCNVGVTWMRTIAQYNSALIYNYLCSRYTYTNSYKYT